MAAAVESEAVIEAAVAAEIAATIQPPIARPTPEVPAALPAPEAVTNGTPDFFAVGRTALGVLAESQTVMARGMEAVALEAAALARSGFAAAADTATAMLGACTLADAIEMQAGFARRSIDVALDGSARLSEIALKTATEASRPILSRLAETWRGDN
jgi:hypothetical protein